MVHKPDFVDHVTGGVKPMSIQGRLARERERLLGMTPEERAWRKQWVKDQILSPNEPKHVPEIYTELTNPIRRFYRKPLDFVFKFTEPVLGSINPQVRYITGKMFLITYAAIFGVYWLKYNQSDWTRNGGWRVFASKRSVLPGEPGYPVVSNRKPQDYAERNFKSSPI